MSSPNENTGPKMLFSGAKWFMIVNIVQRMITFLLNQSMISMTSPEVFGMAAISLELLLSSLLFLSREGIRLACIREKIVTADERQRIVNISWIPSIILTSMLLLLSTFQSKMESFTLFQRFDFDVILMYCSGALFEVMGEPWFNIFQCTGAYGHRLKADTIAVFVRSIITFITVAYFSMGIRGFGYAQMAYGCVHFLTLISATRSLQVNNMRCSFSDFLPRIILDVNSDVNGDSGVRSKPNEKAEKEGKCKNEGNEGSNRIISMNFSGFSGVFSRLIDVRTAGVACTATFSSLLKHLLTEADKIALSLTSSSYNQGIFAVANNYGSLVARMIFLPIEESARIAFSKMASELQEKECSAELEESSVVDTTGGTPSSSSFSSFTPKPSSSSSSSSSSPLSSSVAAFHPHEQLNNATNNDAIQNDNQVKKKDCTANQSTKSVLYRSKYNKLLAMEVLLVKLVQIVTFLGVIFLIFGPLYSRIVVIILFGRDYQGEESVRTLSAVCVNVFVLSLNGVLEAYVHVAAPASSFQSVNIGFIVSSGVYIAAVGPLISRCGTSGLVLAGCLSMVVRIYTSYLIIKNVLTLPSKPSMELFIDENDKNDKSITDEKSKNNKNNKNSMNVPKNNKNSENNESNKNVAHASKNILLSDTYKKPIIIGAQFRALFRPPFKLLISSTFIWTILCFFSDRFFKSPRGAKDILEHIAAGGVGFLSFIFMIFSIISREDWNSILQSIGVRKEKVKIV